MAYTREPEDETRGQPKLPDNPPIQKTGEVKRAFDFLIATPGVVRKGTVRSGAALLGFTDYNIKLFRSDERKWSLYIEWVDLQGDGHRLVFPHEVVQGVLQRAASIIAQGRSERAKSAAKTRKAKGIQPFGGMPFRRGKKH